MLVNILNPYAKGKSIDQTQAHSINWYLVDDQSNGEYPLNAFPTPGNTIFTTLESKTVVRSLFEHHNLLHAVGGNTWYTSNSNGGLGTIGTLTTSTGRVTMASIDTQIIAIDGTNGYHYNTSGGFTQISDVDFVGTATSITSQDGYFIFSKPDSNQFFISALNDGLSYDALDFASITGDSDRIVRVISNHRELWILGNKTIEIWINSGNADFPFERRNDTTYIHYGCSAKDTVCTGDNTLFFLGKSPNGGHCVVRIDGYTPKVVSKDINYQLSIMTDITNAFAFMYQKEGHEFYVLTFPADNKTFVYDLTTEMWHQWSTNGLNNRHISNCFAYCYDKLLIGDYASGNVYQLDYNTYQDNGVAISRKVVTPPFYNEGKLTRIDRLQIDWENVAGSPAVTASVSKDGGRNFTALTPSRTLGSDSTTRVHYDRLGQSRKWVMSIETSMNAKAIILGAFIHGTVGEH